MLVDERKGRSEKRRIDCVKHDMNVEKLNSEMTSVEKNGRKRHKMI